MGGRRARISSVPVRHPGSTVGYRLSENGYSLAYIPDNEPALDRESGLSVAGGADVLFHDAQFTDAEYPSRVGWGHSARRRLRHVPRRGGTSACADVPPRSRLTPTGSSRRCSREVRAAVGA